MSSLSMLSLPLKIHSSSRKSSPIPPLLPNHVHNFGGFSSFRRLSPFPKSVNFRTPARNPCRSRGQYCICFFSGEDSEQNEGGLDWPVLRRWDVPWKWQSATLTSLACGLSFVLTGLIEAAAIPYLKIHIEELSLDEKAELLFVDQAIATAAVLAVLFGLTKSFGPLPEDVFRYDLRKPFDLQSGWLLWAGIGLVGAIIAIVLTGTAVSFFNGESPQRETDALVRLLPLIGSSSTSTACLVGITGVLAPLLEETVFRGFLMVYLTKWLPTPTAILITAAVFAFAHLTPGEFPQLFVLGNLSPRRLRIKCFPQVQYCM
ncbi:OLC1v1032798C4 [Oldenlandia corymbosa var. corymbosa]|uniref:OLC1v1032798C4 n=1 Tax=Oldenlandia corymbosa var. corymbosa TaxID=529605 RepID=A0AAV1CPI7_OLDCO|nr:OLC1v1032798C4 [Oldenlandia corymbosa var. corymbosa]